MVLFFAPILKALCINYGILINQVNGDYLDSSTSDLKAVLLHNGNQKPSIPIARGAHVKKTYENIRSLPEKVGYADHTWHICAEMKVVGILLGVYYAYRASSYFVM